MSCLNRLSTYLSITYQNYLLVWYSGTYDIYICVVGSTGKQKCEKHATLIPDKVV